MTNHTEFNNKTSQPKIKDVIKLLQNKFGLKTPISVSMKRDGSIKKIEVEKKLSIQDKKWVKDLYPELE